jgi:hypothetical protein
VLDEQKYSGPLVRGCTGWLAISTLDKIEYSLRKYKMAGNTGNGNHIGTDPEEGRRKDEMNI